MKHLIGNLSSCLIKQLSFVNTFQIRQVKSGYFLIRQ